MNTTTQATQPLIQIDVATLRRVVQEAVREEMTRFLQAPPSEWIEHWLHEGPDDPDGDAKLLASALVVSKQYRQSREGWKTLDEFETELERAEAAGELPN